MSKSIDHLLRIGKGHHAFGDFLEDRSGSTSPGRAAFGEYHADITGLFAGKESGVPCLIDGSAVFDNAGLGGAGFGGGGDTVGSPRLGGTLQYRRTETFAEDFGGFLPHSPSGNGGRGRGGKVTAVVGETSDHTRFQIDAAPCDGGEHPRNLYRCDGEFALPERKVGEFGRRSAGRCG